MAKAKWQKVSGPPLTFGASKPEHTLTPAAGTGPQPGVRAPRNIIGWFTRAPWRKQSSLHGRWFYALRF
jgi:hypothetical protein